MEPFRVLLNCVDHYQAAPTYLDPQLPCGDGPTSARTRPKVPVIRVFGATETGQKVCAHIHGAFPYLYIEYRGSLAVEQVKAATRSLHVSIDHALAVSYRRNAYDPGTAYVAHISLVKGTPFYGYHVGHKFFFKIYLLNPLHMTRLADLLLQGAVMKRVLQPYESHMQYIPQWMCDYNLYGCAYIDCRKVTFRGPVPLQCELEDSEHQWHDQSIAPALISDAGAFPRQSHCALEVDVHVQDILNRLGIKERPLHNYLFEGLDTIPPDAKLVPSLASLWEDEKRRRKAAMGLTDSESSPFTSADLVSMSADSRNVAAGGWIHEEEFRARVAEIVVKEQARNNGAKPSPASLIQSDPFEASIQSALDSVEDLYPEKLQAAVFDPVNVGDEGVEVDIEVDEARILSLQLPDTSNSCEDSSGSGLRTPQPDSTKETRIRGDLANVRTPRENRERSDEENNTLDSSAHITDAELTSMGVRRSSAIINSQEDFFEIDDEFISKIGSNRTKRSISTAANTQPSKRPRFMLDPVKSSSILKSPRNEMTLSQRPADQVERKWHSAAEEPSSQPKSSQKSNKSDGNSRLQFPVVKDPNDPATISRASQQSGSVKLSHPISGFGSKSALTALPAPHSHSNSDKTTSCETSQLPRSDGVEFDKILRESFNIPPNATIYTFHPPCPSSSLIRETISNDSRPSVVYQNAYYSNDDDVPDRSREYAGREFKLESNTVPYLPPFDPTGKSPLLHGDKPPVVVDQGALERESDRLRKACSLRCWEFAPLPPSRSEVIEWCKEQDSKRLGPQSFTTTNSKRPGISQIEAATQKDSHGFLYSQKKFSRNIQHEAHYMSVMSLEVHVNTRCTLAPNPEEDEISCIFWCIQSGNRSLGVNEPSDEVQTGVLAVAETESIAGKIRYDTNAEIEEESSELDVLTKLVDIVRYYDPDILTGYEVHNGSWGYLIERARVKYDYDLCDELSRVKTDSHGRFGKESDRWGFNHTSTIRVTGRHMINIWRAMRSELSLIQYTLENVAFHLLHKRIPHYPFHDLTKWFKSTKPRNLVKVVNYFITRTRLNLDILDANELISRTSEQARILGIDFFSVFSRGSQFKVESLMFRIAKPENFILISPSKAQVGQQNALECLPLVMEPQSDFYNSPLLVLDFQSLYPSVMIAYNYCYSTFLGRIVDWRGRNKMGFIDYQRQQGLLGLLESQINIAPNGIMYTRPEVRKSLLAKMLSEILETRVMVKGGMKANKEDRALQRLLNNRQLALKLIANVTYGYTSASFSGRMPCAEIADSIVQTARETLEKAIAMIHSVERWGAEVVYGDTDSLFIYLKGRTRDEAFDIGEEIAQKITASNPRPVKLKFEKVYHPCVLLAKKRYVGYKYESRGQTKPEFDAKGIETVRRDGTPAEQKIEEKALRILFETADLSRVKKYFQKQCAKIMQGKVSIQDFCFAKEVRLGTYSEKGPPPPGALISAKRMLEDPRLEPQYGERIPYVVISGAPGSRLIDRCVAPEVLLQDPQMELDAEYYISKNLIPPLERIFNLVGANIRQWYDEMPKYQRVRRTDNAMISDGTLLRKTLESYMRASSCVVCREKLENGEALCNHCLRRPHLSLMRLRYRVQRAEKKVANIHEVCRSCMGVQWGEEVKCDSKDCPVFYSRTRTTFNLSYTRSLSDPIAEALERSGESNPWAW
ncbi:polymerase zeta subunit [Coccidioides immitis RS]|uniref:DNA polymerase n=2 Tax=Coccidioides immitis TaxID=5501 RepID=J3KGX7_COCIM|nr:polymerase zeta subunit [Coccidioides immitis RS]EAS35045.3 polymerase zeta subunit [Coccidioides immitis RS]KMU84445.1 DNA polymerase zeta catalytic subunit [Coccidioides immitis H538.4]